MENKNEKKIRYHSIGKIFYDILRDRNSLKYSMTKVAALIGIILFIIVVLAGVYIMIGKNEVDYILIGEILAFILTLLGFKNKFGVSKDGVQIEGNDIVPQVDVEKLNEDGIDPRG